VQSTKAVTAVTKEERMGGTGRTGHVSLTRRGVLVLLGVAGLAACEQEGGPGTTKQAGGTDAARASANRLTPRPTTGCDFSKLPPRRAAVVAFDGAGRQRWSVPLPVGKDMDSDIGPLVDGDTVYTTEGDELRALAGEDGRQRWRLPLGGFVYDASVRERVLAVRVGPLDRGRLVGVDPAGGRVLWRYPSTPAPLSWQHLSTADGGIVAIGAAGDSGAVVALNRADGTVRWTRPPQRQGIPKVFATAGNRVLRVDRGALEAYDAATGRALWRTPGAHRGQDFQAILTVTGNGVVVWELSSAGTAVTAYGLDTGERRWRVGGLRDPGVVGVGPAGIAAISSIDRDQRDELLLVDLATGRVRWRRGLPGPLNLDMNPAADRVALVTGSDVVLVTPGPRGQAPVFLAAYRAGDGRLRWRTPIEAGGWPTWTPDGRLLVVGSPPDAREPERSLTAVDLRSGRLLWHSPLPLIAERPAAPLGTGAVIQMWDPQRACADVGTASIRGPGSR